jgi:hypothetical protein
MNLASGKVALFLVLAGVSPACVLDDGFESEDGDIDGMELEDENVGESDHELIAANGMSLNGMSLNGMSLNGMSLNGMSLNGMSLNGMSLNGSQLTGFNSSGQIISGSGLVGARMTGQLASGGTLNLRIDSASTLAAPNSDVWAYGVSYQSGTTWVPMCGTVDGAPVLAVPLAGTWDYRAGVKEGGAWTASSTSFSLGCRGAALAKCVELGYKPWKTVGGTLLRDHHQACTRAIRADYCGNGTSYTRDGNLINIYDNKGIQADGSSTWPIDAEWIAAGARCIHHARAWSSGHGIPACFASKAGQCGNFSKGALIINEYKK